MYRIQLDDVSISRVTNPRQASITNKTASSCVSLHKLSFRKMKDNYHAQRSMAQRFDAGCNKLHLKQISFPMNNAFVSNGVI